MKKKLCIILVLVLLLTLVFVGCSAGSYYPDEYPSGSVYDGKYNESSGAYDEIDTSESGEASPDRKIIYTASTRLTVENIKEASSAVRAKLNADEWIESSSIESSYARFVFRIKSSRLEAFLNDLEGIGEVSSTSISSDDVSLSYYNNKVRKATLEAEQTRLISLMGEASVSEIITINKRLSEIETELKRIEGTLKNYDSLVDYSTVTVNIYTKTTVQKETFGSKLLDSMEGGLKFAEALVIFLLTALPFIIVIGGIVVLVIYLVKRHKKIKSGALIPKSKRKQLEVEQKDEEIDNIPSSDDKK